MDWFFGEPPCCGWYFYSPKRKDWDLAIPVAVSRHEYGDGTVRFVAKYKGREFDCEELKAGIWCGPIPKFEPPPKWMQEREEVK